MVTLAGLLPDDEHAYHAVDTLTEHGIPLDQVHVLRRPAEVWTQMGGRRKLRVVVRDAAWGLLIGLGVGLLYGVPAAVAGWQLMDYPLRYGIIAGLLIVAYWLAGGAAVGALVGLDRLERPLYSFVEWVRRGELLVVVDTTEERVAEVAGILADDGGALVRRVEEDV